MNLQTKNQKGFTIVELLIVIVVIGILAAITIVAFTGVQNQAKATKAQAVASDVQKKAEAYNASEGIYPFDLTAFNSEDISKLSGTNTLTAASTTQPTAANGETTVQYVPCGTAPVTAANITGARIHYWDYSASGTNKTTTAGTGGKSLTVGTC